MKQKNLLTRNLTVPNHPILTDNFREILDDP